MLSVTGIAAGEEIQDQYETVVDVVEAGADPEGDESITPVLREQVDDNTLLEFPEGEYYMDEQLRFTGFEDVGFVGDGATLIPADYHEFDGPQYRLFRFGTSDNPGRDLRFVNFDIDQTAANTGIRVLNAEVEDGLFVKDVTIRGVHDSGTWGPGLFNILDSDGHGLVECFRAPDGGVHVDDTPNEGNMWRGPTGINVNQNHRGTLVFTDCSLGGFPDNGLYASGETGQIEVEGGLYRNSGTASIRLTGMSGSISDAILVVDENPHDSRGQHAIRLDGGDRFEIDGITIDASRPNGDAIRIMNDVDETEISNSQIAVGDHPSNGIKIDSGAGSTSIDDVDIEIDGSANAVRVLGEDGGSAELSDVRITGDASGTVLRHAIYCERNGCQFTELDVEQRGDNRRRGIELRGSDYLVSDSEFETTDVPIVVNDATDVRIENCYGTTDEGRNSLRITAGSGSVQLDDNDFPEGVRDDR